MSTLKTVNLQHPNSSNVNMVLGADGSVSGGLPSPNRNLIYNGAMQVHQRGTSATGINQSSSDTFLADRWATGMYNGPTGTFTMSIENDAPTGTGFRKSVKLLCTSGGAINAASIASLYQRFEGQDLQRIAKGTASAKPLTLSFWVKSNVTGTYAIRFNDVNNSRIYVANYTVSASGTWERKVISIAADATGAFNNDNALSLVINFYLVAGSNSNSGTASSSWVTSGSEAAGMNVNVGATTSNYWQITGAQLETGSAPTDFEFKSYAQELRECQRYYEKSYMQNVVPGTANQGDGCVIHFIDGLNSATRTLFYTVNYKVTKRAAAPIVAYSTVTGTINKIRDINATADVNASYSVYSDSGAVVYWVNGASQTSFNNQFQWTASAEL